MDGEFSSATCENWMGNSAAPPAKGTLAVLPVITIFACSVTVTEQVAVLPPSAVVTVIVADPGLTAVTLPLPSTVAISVAEDFQLTDLLVALSGDTVAVSVSDPPSTRLRLVLLSDTPVTATVWVPPSLPPEGVGSFLSQPMNIPAEITAAAMNKTDVPNNFLIAQLINNKQFPPLINNTGRVLYKDNHFL